MDNRIIKIRKIIPWIFVALWMLIILNLSSQVASQSNQLSTGVADILIKVIKRILPQVNPDILILNSILRKLAHFFAYMIMAILLLNAFNKTRIKGSMNIFLVLLICFIFAVSDEVLQLFIDGRGAQFKDVVIDSSGAICGVILYLFIGRFVMDRKIDRTDNPV